MTNFNGVQNVGGGQADYNSGDYASKVRALQAQMASIAASIPDQMPAGMSESERNTYIDTTVAKKDQIIALKKEIRKLAEKSDPDIIPILDSEIAQIEQEKTKLLSMKTSNIFANNTKRATSSPSIFSQVFG